MRIAQVQNDDGSAAVSDTASEDAPSTDENPGPEASSPALVSSESTVYLASVTPIEHRMTAGLASTIAAARAIRSDAGSSPCTVIARATPQLMWYSGCDSFKVRGPDDIGASAPAVLEAPAQSDYGLLS